MNEASGILRAPAVRDLPPEGSIPLMNQSGRVTITGGIAFQLAGGEPLQYSLTDTEILTTQEDPYDRHITIGEEWQELDTGWVKECSILYLYNTETGNWSKIPTAEERAKVNARIVDIGVFHPSNPSPIPFLLLPPGKKHSLRPVEGVKVMVRCRKGKARVRIVALCK